MAENRKTQPRQPDKTQAERFKETARELGVDETGKQFDRLFEKIVPPRPRKKDS